MFVEASVCFLPKPRGSKEEKKKWEKRARDEIVNWPLLFHSKERLAQTSWITITHARSPIVQGYQGALNKRARLPFRGRLCVQFNPLQ